MNPLLGMPNLKLLACRYCGGPKALTEICGCPESVRYFGKWSDGPSKPATPEPMGKEVVVAEFDGQRYTRFDRPATPEPPEWKGENLLDPSILDRALSDFIAKRKAKHKVGLTKWKKAVNEEMRALYTEQEAAEAERADPIARAFSLPISFTARMGMRVP